VAGRDYRLGGKAGSGAAVAKSRISLEEYRASLARKANQENEEKGMNGLFSTLSHSTDVTNTQG